MPTIKLSNLRKILNINCSEKNNFRKKCDLAILSDIETDDFTLWEYEVGFEDCMDVEEITEKFLNVFGSKIKKLKELKKKFSLDYNVYYTVKIHNKRLPSVAFSEEMMKFLNEIKARCGFDMYDVS